MNTIQQIWQQISTNINKYEQITNKTNMNKYQQISTNNKYQQISTNMNKYNKYQQR